MSGCGMKELRSSTVSPAFSAANGFPDFTDRMDAAFQHGIGIDFFHDPASQ